MKFSNIETSFIGKLLNRGIGATLGGDPEFFIKNGSNEVVASDKFFPGKENPIKFEGIECYDTKEKGCNDLKLFFDGIQAEMNIGIQRCREYVAENIRRCIVRSYNIIKKKGKDYDILIEPSVRVSKKVIEEADPEARRFGCMPDFNAYTLTTNTSKIDATNHPYRYAGGHIHLGASSPYIKKSGGEYKIAKTEEGHIRIIKLLDLTVGILSVILDDSKAASIRRLEYGKAGCFRPTPYGIEYRTPSSWWIKSPITVSLVLGLARLAWTIAGNSSEKNMDEELFKLIGYSPEDIRGICDESDKGEAIKVWNELRMYLSIVGDSESNPIFYKKMKSKTVYLEKFDPMKGDSPTFMDAYGRKTSEKEVLIGKSMFSLAAIGYLVKNGLNSLISSNVGKEWSMHKKFHCTDGFVNGMQLKLFSNNAIGKDFLTFQNSLLKELC